MTHPRLTAMLAASAALVLVLATVSVTLARPSMAQPVFLFPWDKSQDWYFSGGPHPMPRGSGLDFAPPWSISNPRALSVAGGTVSANYRDSWGLGWVVKIDHGGGWETWYAHLADQSSLKVGARVPQGQYIGYAGTSGNATGTHVHVELYYNGSPVSWHGKVIDGWTVYSSGSSYYGYLEKGGTRIYQDGLVTSSTNTLRYGCPTPTPTPTPAPRPASLVNPSHETYGPSVAGGAGTTSEPASVPGC